MEKKLDGNYTRLLQAVLKGHCRTHPTKQVLYSHLPPITKTIHVRRTRHARHCRRSKDELISDILLWTSSHERGRPTGTYIQQLCADTGYSLENHPGAMDDRNVWRERIREIRAGNTTWWWWWSAIWKGLRLGRSNKSQSEIKRKKKLNKYFSENLVKMEYEGDSDSYNNVNSLNVPKEP